MNNFIALMFVVFGVLLMSAGWGESGIAFVLGLAAACIGLCGFAQGD